MFVLEKTYDIDELMRNNMHTHSHFSKCAKPEMILSDMVAEAERCGLKTLAVTDHSDLHDGICLAQNYRRLKKQLEKLETPVRVLIGSELSAYGIGKFAEPYRIDSMLDYRNYTCVHYHLKYWEQPADRSPRGYAVHMIKMLESLFSTDRADCVAHPFSPMKMKFFSDEEKHAALAAITDSELGDIMEKGEKAMCAWEIHLSSFITYPEFYKRFFNIGKEIGVHFNVGTDAHRLESISTADFAEKIKNIIK